jgi:flagellar biogenesis protein FliO
MNPTFDLIRACLALLFVLGTIVSLGFLVRKYGSKFGLPTMPLTGNKRRLHIVEVLSIDGKNKAVLLRRDDSVEHLVLVGTTDSIVIEKDIAVQKTELV